MKKLTLRTILYSLTHVMRLTARRSAGMSSFMGRRHCVAQIRLRDGSVARHYVFQGGLVSSRAGQHPKPDVTMTFRDRATAL